MAQQQSHRPKQLWIAATLTGSVVPHKPEPPHARCDAMVAAATYKEAVARLKQLTARADVVYSVDYSDDGIRTNCFRMNGPIPLWSLE